MSMGICKLTNKYGKFVRSHIIPRALTYPEEQGASFIQYGVGTKPKKRWSSWYDPELVIGEGEKILADLDVWAIKFLRKKKLVWSGWRGMESILNEVDPIPEIEGWGIREINVKEPEKLRRFMLSLLWRAAASELPEFKEIEISSENLERLRKVVLSEQDENLDFYPASLVQLSTFGIIHNQTPLAQILSTPSPPNIPIFRFYFDGLIIHFYNHAENKRFWDLCGPQVVGNGNLLVVTTVKFENSFQAENLFKIFNSYNNL